jgi:hypothetical protein
MTADDIIAARAVLDREPRPSVAEAATIVYSYLLVRHLAAAQRDPNGADRKRLYNLIEALSVEFPSEIKVWDDLHSPKDAAR